MNIREKLLNIQKELIAPKSQYNSFGKYNYRNCEDILEAVKPLLEKNKCTLLLKDEIVLIGDRYYVKAIATSVDGMRVETEKYGFTVRYSYPSMFNLLDLVNVCEKGYVRIESNVESIEGETAPEFTPPIYLNAFQVTDPSIYVQWGVPFEYDMENLQPISEWTELSLIDLHQLGNWVR